MLAAPPRPGIAVLAFAALAVAFLACGGVDFPAPDLASETAAVGNGPDLIIQSVSGPPSSLSGGTFQVQVTMCNQGTWPATAPAGVYLSLEGMDGGTDGGAGAQIGQTPSMSLEPGTCNTASAPAGAYV